MCDRTLYIDIDASWAGWLSGEKAESIDVTQPVSWWLAYIGKFPQGSTEASTFLSYLYDILGLICAKQVCMPL